jgi:hypothetical protein
MADDTDTGDEFSGHDPLPGLEHLGRHIRDRNGIPSGSPANFEHLRGVTGEPELPDADEIIAQLQAEFGGGEGALGSSASIG